MSPGILKVCIEGINQIKKHVAFIFKNTIFLTSLATKFILQKNK